MAGTTFSQSDLVAGGGYRPKDPTEKQFTEALTSAVEQNLNGAGFKLAGPYDSLEEMTFPQKKQADLVVKLSSGVKITTPQGTPEVSSLGALTTKYSGNCELTGHVSMEIWEPISAQRIWTKRVEMPTATENCTGSEMTVIKNARAKLFESAFAETTKKLDQHISPEEIESFRKQAKELRDKKVY